MSWTERRFGYTFPQEHLVFSHGITQLQVSRNPYQLPTCESVHHVLLNLKYLRLQINSLSTNAMNVEGYKGYLFGDADTSDLEEHDELIRMWALIASNTTSGVAKSISATHMRISSSCSSKSEVSASPNLKK
jgi:hypothetical protein